MKKLTLLVLIFFEYCTCSVLIVPALGRTADFGDIYDARSNKFTRDKIFKQSLPQNLKTLIENPHSRYDFTSAKSSSEKLKAFDITGELKLQIMCGIVDIGGSAKYLTDNKYTTNDVVSTYILKSKIAKETINWKDEGLKDFIDFGHVVDDGTHVVVGIQYGGNGVVTLSQKISENTDQQSIQAKLDATVKIFNNVGFSGSVGGSFNSTTQDNSDSIKIKVEADVNIEAEDDLTTLAGTYEFMKKLSGRLLKYNSNKGIQISFEMIPLDTISKYYQKTSPHIFHFSPLSIHHYSAINHKLTKIENLIELFNERYFELQNSRIYFNETEQEWFDEIKSEFDKNVTILYNRIDKDIVSFHNKSATHDDIAKKELHVNPLKRAVKKFREESESLIEKLNYIKYALENGTIYIDSMSKWYDIIRRYDKIMFCFFSKINQKRFREAIELFVKFPIESNAVYALVNADKILNMVQKEILLEEDYCWPLYIYMNAKYYAYQWGRKSKRTTIPSKITESNLKTTVDYLGGVEIEIFKGNDNLIENTILGTLTLQTLQEKAGIELFDLSLEVTKNATLIAELKSQKSNKTAKFEVDLLIY